MSAIDDVLSNLDKTCPKCYGQGHGGDGCLYCWKHDVEQEAIAKAKQELKSLMLEVIENVDWGIIKHQKSELKARVDRMFQ